MELTLLSKDDIADYEPKKLEVIKKYGAHAIATDLTIALGGDFRIRNISSENESLENRETSYFTNYLKDEYVACYSADLGLKGYWQSVRIMGVRPVLKLDEGAFNEVIKDRHQIEDLDVYEVELGEYPQWTPKEQIQKELNSGLPRKTGKSYSFDMTNNSIHNSKHSRLVNFKEYEYDEKKYINIRIKSSQLTHFSNNMLCEYDKYIWIEVSPVKWLIDFENKRLISKNCLLAGMPINGDVDGYPITDFKWTPMYEYLNNHLLKELNIRPVIAISKININEQRNALKELERKIDNSDLNKEELEEFLKAIEEEKNDILLRSRRKYEK